MEFLNYVLYAMFAIVAVYTVRTLLGPSSWDRLMGMNLITTKVIMIIFVYAAANNNTHFLDVGLVFALFGFIGTTFVALFLAKYKLGKFKSGEEIVKKDGGDA